MGVWNLNLCSFGFVIISMVVNLFKLFGFFWESVENLGKASLRAFFSRCESFENNFYGSKFANNSSLRVSALPEAWQSTTRQSRVFWAWA